MKPKVLAIVGPTASGKSAFAIRLAEAFDGEVVGADSVQVYRGFDIGSAKPSPEERETVVHHLIDVADPCEDFTAADYARAAADAIEDIRGRRRLPIVAGGTGLYLRALFEGLMPTAGKDEAVRASLGRLDTETLRARLEKVDPVRAAEIQSGDRLRLIRALEIFETTGETPSKLGARHERTSRYDVLWVGLAPPREELYRRINERCEAMWRGGWLDEVKQLEKEGFGGSRAMASVGYAEVYSHLFHNVPADEALGNAKQRTRRYAKRQLTWFRANPSIHWFDPREPDTFDGIRFLLQEWLT